MWEKVKTSKKGKCSLREEPKTCRVEQEYVLWWAWLLFLYVSLQHGYPPSNVDCPLSSFGFMEVLECTPLPKIQVCFNLFLLASTFSQAIHLTASYCWGTLSRQSFGGWVIPARQLKPSHPTQDLPRKLRIMVNSGMQAFPDLSHTIFL